MARRKKPVNETAEQAEIRNTFEIISNFANRSEKTSWKRKLVNMEKFIEELHPIEQKILNIIKDEKQPILDKVFLLRKEMVKECVHPFEHLVQREDHVECKFCNRKIRVPNAKKI